MIGRIALAAALLAVAGAQGISVESSDVGLIEPEIDYVPTELTVTLSCTEWFFVTPPGTMAATFHIRYDFPATAVAVGPTAALVTGDPCLTNPNGNLESKLTYDVGVTREAPGLELMVGTVTVELDDQNPAPDPNGTPLSASTQASLTPKFYGKSVVKIAEPIRDVEPGEQVVIAVDVQNFGNARTTHVFVRDDPSKIDWIAPEPLILDAPNSGGQTSGTAYWTATAPSHAGFNNGLSSLEFHVILEATDDPSITETGPSGSALLRVRGFATVGDDPVAVPGPGIVAVLAVAGLAARRRA